MWLLGMALASATEPSSPWDLKPDSPETEKAGPAQPQPRVETRLVLFTGFGGQTLHLDGDEAGRLPMSTELTLGEHTWVVHDHAGVELRSGSFRVRPGDGNQVVVVEPPPPDEDAVSDEPSTARSP